MGLAGDSVDNIPGVAGIGKKTAADLLARFGHLEELYERLEEVRQTPGIRGGKSLYVKLEGAREMAIRVTGYERPHRLAISGAASRLEMDAVYELTGDDRATSVVMSAEVRPKGLLRAMGPVIEAATRSQLKERPEQLRRALAAAAG